MAVVLVVEDGADLAHLVRRELEQAGHRVVAVADGCNGSVMAPSNGDGGG